MFRKVFAIGLISLQAFWFSGCASLEKLESSFDAFMVEMDQDKFENFVQKQTELADNGDVNKQLEIAKMYLHGSMPDSLQEAFHADTWLPPPYRFTIHRNKEAAIDLLYKAALQDNAEAKWLYALIVINGDGSAKADNDSATAKKFLQELADKGDTKALSLLGVCYVSGTNVIEKDIKKAKEIFDKVHDEPYTKLGLSLMYYKGEGFKKDIKKSFNLAQEAANAGVIEGKLTLAGLYLKGEGCEASPQKAVELAHQAYLDSFELGSGQSITTQSLSEIVFVNPAFDYKYGNTTRSALEEMSSTSNVHFKKLSHKLIAAFADQGRLGFTKIDGLKSLYVAAELGDADAGKEVAEIEKIRLETLNKAEQGDAQAQLSMMNYFYYVGDNFVPDPQRGIYYAKKLVDNNNPQAMVFLANVHLQGVHLPNDTQKVLSYMQTAANMGDPTAIKFISEYQASLQAQQQQLIQAQRNYIMQRQVMETVRLINNL